MVMMLRMMTTKMNHCPLAEQISTCRSIKSTCVDHLDGRSCRHPHLSIDLAWWIVVAHPTEWGNCVQGWSFPLIGLCFDTFVVYDDKELLVQVQRKKKSRDVSGYAYNGRMLWSKRFIRNEHWASFWASGWCGSVCSTRSLRIFAYRGTAYKGRLSNENNEIWPAPPNSPIG